MIDTDEKLGTWLPKVRKATWVALDTEADSLHAYPEKLCLIQLGIPGTELLVDPLSGIHLAPLWRALEARELILHGADYDLRLLNKDGGFVPESIFDTMWAARLLGYRQFGLTDLVFRFLGIHLEKGPQKANWARRPLTDRMEAYARNDVRHLPQLAAGLRQQLEEKGRLSWHQEACQRLIADSKLPRRADPEEIWRVKGSHRLDPPALGVLKAIWHWREQEALRCNKPPYFILSPATMVELAKAATDGESVESCLPPRFSPRRKTGLTNAINRGLNLPAPSRPRPSSGRRPSGEQQRRYRELEAQRNRQAHDLGIDPTLIASRATLLALAKDHEHAPAQLMVWQRSLLDL